MIPDRPGYWWWRVDASCKWEIVEILKNSDDEFIVRWIGKSGFSFLSIVGGEWLGMVCLNHIIPFVNEGE
jgi:hypothetical protein